MITFDSRRPPMRWIRWRARRWSIWHRAPEWMLFGVWLPRRTSCGFAVPTDAEIEPWAKPGLPDEPRCQFCLRNHLLRTLPPLGSPGSESPGPRVPLVRVTRRRRSPLQPAL